MHMMAVHKMSLVRDDYKNTEEWQIVSDYSDQLFEYISQPDILQSLEAANVPGASSQEIQNILLHRAKELGFRDESKGLFLNYQRNLRPDFYLEVYETGIINEVERGKTNQNNMDFLDFWKCHICEVAHYLFLFVPNILIQNSSGEIAGRPYQKVVQNFEPFFQIANYTNVRGVVIFGY